MQLYSGYFILSAELSKKCPKQHDHYQVLQAPLSQHNVCFCLTLCSTTSSPTIFFMMRSKNPRGRMLPSLTNVENLPRQIQYAGLRLLSSLTTCRAHVAGSVSPESSELSMACSTMSLAILNSESGGNSGRGALTWKLDRTAPVSKLMTLIFHGCSSNRRFSVKLAAAALEALYTPAKGPVAAMVPEREPWLMSRAPPSRVDCMRSGRNARVTLMIDQTLSSKRSRPFWMSISMTGIEYPAPALLTSESSDPPVSSLTSATHLRMESSDRVSRWSISRPDFLASLSLDRFRAVAMTRHPAAWNWRARCEPRPPSEQPVMRTVCFLDIVL